ncbi:hypothetical protein FACS1894200_03690 [Spirochaetia bacterium]|nr:hypothetical protein FACS1894200_03690 [Spirochaetia bacterium]
MAGEDENFPPVKTASKPHYYRFTGASPSCVAYGIDMSCHSSTMRAACLVGVGEKQAVLIFPNLDPIDAPKQ